MSNSDPLLYPAADYGALEIRILQNLMASPTIMIPYMDERNRLAYSAFCMTWVTVAWAMLVGRAE